MSFAVAVDEQAAAVAVDALRLAALQPRRRPSRRATRRRAPIASGLNSGRSIARMMSTAQTILASPSAGKAISSASSTSVGVQPSRSARPRYWRKPRSVCACTLVITEIRSRVFGSRCLPAVLEEGEVVAHGLGPGLDQVGQCVAHVGGLLRVGSTCTSTGHSASPMTFCATPPIQARARRVVAVARRCTSRSAPQALRRGDQLAGAAGRRAPRRRRRHRALGACCSAAASACSAARRARPRCGHAQPRAAAARIRPPRPRPRASVPSSGACGSTPTSTRRRPHAARRAARPARCTAHAPPPCSTISPTSRLARKPRWPRRRMTIRSARALARLVDDLAHRARRRGAPAARAPRRPRAPARAAAAALGGGLASALAASCGATRLVLRVADQRQHRGQRQLAALRQREGQRLGAGVEFGVFGGQQQAREERAPCSVPSASASPRRPARTTATSARHRSRR